MNWADFACGLFVGAVMVGCLWSLHAEFKIVRRDSDER